MCGELRVQHARSTSVTLRLTHLSPLTSHTAAVESYKLTIAHLINEKDECFKSIEEAKAQMAKMEKRIPAIDRELSKMHKRLVSLQAINVDDDDEDEGVEGEAE